jgi:hypothetical protein
LKNYPLTFTLFLSDNSDFFIVFVARIFKLFLFLAKKLISLSLLYNFIVYLQPNYKLITLKKIV